jgi:hypothetical protein
MCMPCAPILWVCGAACTRAVAERHGFSPCVMQEDKCDIKALIEFESVVKGDRGDTLNALRFNILVEDV